MYCKSLLNRFYCTLDCGPLPRQYRRFNSPHRGRIEYQVSADELNLGYIRERDKIGRGIGYAMLRGNKIEG